jgi:hypothetical protein
MDSYGSNLVALDIASRLYFADAFGFLRRVMLILVTTIFLVLDRSVLMYHNVRKLLHHIILKAGRLWKKIMEIVCKMIDSDFQTGYNLCVFLLVLPCFEHDSISYCENSQHQRRATKLGVTPYFRVHDTS